MPDIYTVRVSNPPVPYLSGEPFDVEVRQDTAIQVMLRRGLLLAGRVVDEKGEAIDHTAQVYLYSEDGGLDYGKIIESQDGSFSMGVEPGRYRVRAFWQQVDSPYPNQELGIIEIKEDTEIDFALRRGVSISGKVVDEEGRRARGGYLQFVSAEGFLGSSLLVNSDGTYAVSLFPGRYRVYASWVGGEDMPPSQPLGEVNVVQDTVLNWILRSGEIFQGWVVDAEGRGVAGLNIYARSLESSVSNGGMTDADGFFSLQLLPGEYRLFQAKSLGMGSDSVEWNLGYIEVPAEGVAEVRQPSGAILRAEIMDSRGRPVSGNLKLLPGPFKLRDLLEGEVLVSVSRYGGSYEGSQFDIEVRPGRYAALVPGDFSGLSRVVQDVMVEGETRLDIVLPDVEDTCRLSGRVLRRGEEIQGRVDLYFYDEQQGIVNSFLADEDRYRAELPAGVYQVAVGLYEESGRAARMVSEYGPLEVTGDRTWDVVLGEDTGVSDESGAMPAVFALWQNYPNPFNARTVIAYQLPQAAEVELVVYNIMGQKVKVLVQERQEAGMYRVEWDGTDGRGRAVGSGVYLCRLRAGDFLQTRRLALLK